MQTFMIERVDPEAHVAKTVPGHRYYLQLPDVDEPITNLEQLITWINLHPNHITMLIVDVLCIIKSFTEKPEKP